MYGLCWRVHEFVLTCTFDYANIYAFWANVYTWLCWRVHLLYWRVHSRSSDKWLFQSYSTAFKWRAQVLCCAVEWFVDGWRQVKLSNDALECGRMVCTCAGQKANIFSGCSRTELAVSGCPSIALTVFRLSIHCADRLIVVHPLRWLFSGFPSIALTVHPLRWLFMHCADCSCIALTVQMV